jgi:hypothetical protein
MEVWNDGIIDVLDVLKYWPMKVKGGCQIFYLPMAIGTANI